MGRAPVQVHGEVAPGFEPVRAAFVENFQRRDEIGAAVCVTHRGRVVVDLWAGVADRDTQRPWAPDTLNILFSTTKGIAAIAMLMLADRGGIDYDRPVADYWPGFAQHGKGAITVRTLLNHRAGLVALDQPLTLDDFEHHPERVVAACEQQRPYWTPDTDQGYHGVTYGPYIGELFRRAAGESIGQFLAREVSGPLQADVYLGLPDDKRPQVATNYPIGKWEAATRVIPKLLAHPGLEGRVYRQVVLRGDASRAFANPAELGPKGMQNYNAARVHRMELPWAGALGSARGLARVYGALANGGAIDGVRLVSPEAIAPLTRRQSWVERDRVLRKPAGWSQGFIKEETRLFSPNPESFGHPGAGGCLGWCDPKAQLSIGYVINRMGHHIRSPRALALCHALYRSPGLQ